MNYEKLNEKILSLKDDMFRTIRESVAIESVKSAPRDGAPYGLKNQEALEHLLSVGEAMGFSTGCCDNRVGWIEYGEGEEMVGVLGHLDVVPLGDGWHYPPLACEVHDGKMYGRGVQDDKGPTIGAVYALKAIKDLGLPISRRIRVLFGLDEECGSSCVAHYIAKGGELPTIGFTPDAEFPAIFSEKGQSFFSVDKKIAQPSKFELLSLEGGMAKNAVAAYCKMVVKGDLDISENEFVTVQKDGENTIVEATGVSAHGSTPEKGINAISLLLKAIKEVHFGGDFKDALDFLHTYISTETDGKALGISHHDEETGNTTVNLGTISYKNGNLNFTLDIRYPNGIDQALAVSLVKEKLEAYRLAYDTEEHEMLYVARDSELITKLMRVYAAQTGDTQTMPIAIGGGTYAKAFKNMVAFGPIFPGETEVIHQPDEFADVLNLTKAVQIIGAAMYELAQK